MYEFVCEHIVPGCTKRDKDESRDELLERVAVHLREHHDLDHREDRISRALRETGVVFIHPA